MLFRLCAICLLLSSLCDASSHCPAYPAGEWKFDAASALRFEQVWLKGLQHKDVAVLDCILAADFKDTSRKGALRPKAQVLRELASQREQDNYQQALTSLDAALFADTAVVRGVNIISDQQGHEVLRIRFTDVLHYEQGRWLAVSAQETDEQ